MERIAKSGKVESNFFKIIIPPFVLVSDVISLNIHHDGEIKTQSVVNYLTYPSQPFFMQSLHEHDLNKAQTIIYDEKQKK